jgi:hypothetical protein
VVALLGLSSPGVTATATTIHASIAGLPAKAALVFRSR